MRPLRYTRFSVALSAGDRLGPYEVISPLGAGGMGEVYRARDPRLGRDVAIKILPEHGDRSRFRAEARALAALNHPGIVAIYDVGEGYLVTELIDGAPLKAANTKQAVELAAKAAEALAAAHGLGVIHRDLKPANILVTRDERVKLIDFGLVKHSSGGTGEDAATLTADGAVMGTAAYMAPEQIRGESVDARGDLFSLGILLYEAIAGRRPFTGETSAQTMAAILEKEPEALAEDVSEPLRRIVARCLAKNREQRYQNALDLAFALRSLAAPTSAGPVVVQKKQGRAAWAVAGVAVIAAIIAVWVGRDRPSARLVVSPVSQESGGETSPVYSPDGKALVYQLQEGAKRRLMLRTEGSAEPVELADGLQLRRGPNGIVFWWPDSTRVYFDRNDALWQVGTSGGPAVKVLERFRAATITPDGKAILLAGGDLLLMRSEPPGAGPVPVPSAPKVPESTFHLRVSPDGAKLLASAQDGLYLSPLGGVWRRVYPVGARSPVWFRDSRHVLISDFPRREILWLDVETGEQRSIHATGEILNGSALRPSGRDLIIGSGNQGQDILEFATDGKHTRSLASTPASEVSPSWGKDGEFLAYGRRVGDAVSIMVRDIRANTTREIHRAPVTGRSPSVVVSPDGKRIAYSVGDGIHTIPMQGGVAQRIGEGNSPMRIWSPDGAWIAVGRNGRQFKIPSQGGAEVSLGSGSLMAWTRDGLYFAENGRLWRQPEKSGGREDLGDWAHGQLISASVTADGKTLFGSTSDNKVIARELAAGTQSREIPIETAAFIRGVAIHPEGKRMAVYLENLQYDLWRIEGFPLPETGWRRLFRKWVYPEPRPEAEPTEQ